MSVSCVGDLEELKELNLFSNQLVGLVPTSFRFLRRLDILKIHDNSLTGTVSPDLCGIADRIEADCRELTCQCCTTCWFQCAGPDDPECPEDMFN